MMVLNFSHPLNDEQRRQLEILLGARPTRWLDVPVHFDVNAPFGPQVAALADACGLGSDEWQELPILVVPPALNFIAVLLLAELHGRMGYFPTCLRLRPVEGAQPPRFEVAEVLNLQAQRDAARARRGAA